MDATSQRLLISRAAIGLAQGLALYLLYSAADDRVWPATQGLIFAPLLLVALAVPLGLNLSLGACPGKGPPYGSQAPARCWRCWASLTIG